MHHRVRRVGSLESLFRMYYTRDTYYEYNYEGCSHRWVRGSIEPDVILRINLVVIIHNELPVF